MLLGVDTGGTFTDFVFISKEGVRFHKVLSTPHAPELAILQGIKELGVDKESLRIVHGSTVATNAVLEKKGVRCCFITNKGFADMLTIGRQARKELYNLSPAVEPPPVPRELCLETSGRLSAQGECLMPITDEDLAILHESLEKLKPDAVAINLLFSFLDDEGEKQIEAMVPEDVFTSRSSQVLPEYKEYERGMATWLNAYVGPLVDGYLQRLTEGVKAQSVSVMQSSGGTIAVDQAAQQAVRMLLSGPAGGLMGALHMGQLAGLEKLMTLDMGGTSTDVSLLDGSIALTNEGKIGDYPVAVPMVDMHTIGAGGGSLASIDAGGLLCVGPESAGASPGPVCYGQGGDRITVTDANLFLGRLSANYFLGGKMSLDRCATEDAMNTLAKSLGCSATEAAEGVISIANEHMARALRVISIQRGIDPQPYALMTFGGAGALHVCALADALEMKTAIVPVYSGVLSAFGMLAAPRSRQLSKSLVGALADISDDDIQKTYSDLIDEGMTELKAEGVPKEKVECQRWVDLRYLGQSFTLPVSWQVLKDENSALKAIEDFHALHEKRYGHQMDLPIELVTVRVTLSGEMPRPKLNKQTPTRLGIPVPELSTTGEHKDWVSSPIYLRDNLQVGDVLLGEALIVETVATTYLAPNWQCAVDEYGNLKLSAMSTQ
jgi:N-methylhydantoinase A